MDNNNLPMLLQKNIDPDDNLPKLQRNRRPNNNLPPSPQYAELPIAAEIDLKGNILKVNEIDTPNKFYKYDDIKDAIFEDVIVYFPEKTIKSLKKQYIQ